MFLSFEEMGIRDGVNTKGTLIGMNPQLFGLNCYCFVMFIMEGERTLLFFLHLFPELAIGLSFILRNNKNLP